MPENWPVRSDYNSKWVIGAWAEAKEVCGFDLKILKKLCSLWWFWSYKNKFAHKEDVHPTLYAQKGLKVTSYIWGKHVYKCVFTC